MIGNGMKLLIEQPPLSLHDNTVELELGYDNWRLKPHTLLGDTNWQDCVLEADVLLAGGDV